MATAYITAPREVAANLADVLIDERLAACVNIVECESVYRWEGDIHHEDEAILLAKTSEQAFPALEGRVEAEHPHDVPCIERFDEDVLLPSFARWRDGAVG